MPMNMIPEFTDVSTVPEPVIEEVNLEKETPPSLPTEQDSVESQETPVVEETPHDDSALALSEVQGQVKGLQDERVKLLKEIQELRGQRREIKREELIQVDKKLDDLKDVNPDDVNLIDKVLRSKGYLTKEESQKMFYESVKQEELTKFLEKYPEYKPENDPHDVNWNTLQRELGFYRMPEDPRKIQDVLSRAHSAIAKPADRERQTLEVKRQQIKTAGVGSGGTQRSSAPVKTLTPTQRATYERGGWTDEEIAKIESRL